MGSIHSLVKGPEHVELEEQREPQEQGVGPKEGQRVV